MAVDQGPAMARDMLDHAEHAGRMKPVEDRPAERGDLHRLRSQRPVADDVGRAGLADVEHRQAVDVDPHFVEHEGQRPRIDASRLDRARRSQLVQAVERLAAGKGRPFRRPHARYPAAFLVDQDRHVRPSGDVAQTVGQPPHLVAAFAVAAEQDETGRVGVAEEVALFRRDLRPGEPVDRCLHQFATKQFSPATFSAWQA